MRAHKFGRARPQGSAETNLGDAAFLQTLEKRRQVRRLKGETRGPSESLSSLLSSLLSFSFFFLQH